MAATQPAESGVPPRNEEKPKQPRSFRSLVEERVHNPLQRDAIAQTDLPTRRFVEEAIEHEAEIKAGVVAQQEAMDTAFESAKGARKGLRQVLGLGAAAAFASGLAIASFSATISGFLILTALLVVLWLALTFIRSDATLRRGEYGDRIRTSELSYGTALERAVDAWIAERANLALGEIYGTELPDIDPEGLAEIDGGDSEISTEVSGELEALIDSMPGGCIGVSGPRGAGKTTLLRRATSEARRRDPDKVAAGLVVDAPVDYDARDFVLHLFARVCEEVLGHARVETLRGWDRGFGGGLARRPLGRAPGIPLPAKLGPILVAVGAILYGAVLDARGEIHLASLGPLAVLLIVIGMPLSMIAYAPWALEPVAVAQLLRQFFKSEQDPKKELQERAARHLRQIWFQRTFSSGWSGALKTPIGIEAGGQQGTQLAENQLNFPDVVRLYKEFVTALAQTGEVRIGIDELDKMDDDRARRFLNEIKVVFRVSGCFYLVSVSEDAMSYFERRGLPFRDVFDSSFDDVLRVGYLPYRDSHRLLRRRVVGLPIQFVALCHILGGGLARDVIRVARDVCEHPRGTMLAEITDQLCTDQLRSKCAAAQVAVRRLQDPRHVTLLSHWLSGLDAAAHDPAHLHELCREFQAEFVDELGPPPKDGTAALTQYREALSIALEIITFTYFVVTVRHFLIELKEEAETKAAIANSILDLLAKAHQAFAINPGQAWEAISRTRESPLGISRIDRPALNEQVGTA